MGLFDKRTPEEQAAAARAEAEAAASFAAIERGGIPLKAEQRLRELENGGSGFFTSDLSVNEFALSHRIGVQPITQVMGSSIYHVGWQPTPAFYSNNWWMSGSISQELTVLSRAWNQARLLSFGRLAQEAKLAGADAVIGVHLKKGAYDWVDNGIEFIAAGTAVKIPGAPPREQPLLCNLNGEDFWKLWVAGYEPYGVVGGSGVFYIVPSWQTQNTQGGWFGSWNNQELSDFTQGVYDAREISLGRMTAEAYRLGADGVIGVEIEQEEEVNEVEVNDREREDLIVTFHILGTAIGERRSDGLDIPVHPVINLRK